MRETPEMQRRLEALERSHRRWRVFALVACALVIVGFRSQGVPEMVSARGFELVDADGTVWAELRLDDGEPGLYLLDAEGTRRVSLAHRDDDTALYLRDVAGDVRIGIAQFAHGGGGVALHGPSAEGAAVLYLKEEGSLTFYRADGEILHRVPSR